MLAAMTAKVFRQCGQCDWTETSTKIGHVATGHHIHMVLSPGQGEAWTVGVGFDDWVDQIFKIRPAWRQVRILFAREYTVGSRRSKLPDDCFGAAGAGNARIAR
jgi:hypothetical protein